MKAPFLHNRGLCCCLVAMSKRHFVAPLPSPKTSRKQPRKQATLKELRLYQKSYKGGGTNDSHHVVFGQALKWALDNNENPIQTVLYPGCHRHLTAALLFPHATFVDVDSKVGSLYRDEAARDYVLENHVAVATNDDDDDSTKGKKDPTYNFHCADVNDSKFVPTIGVAEEKDKPTPYSNYDLLISLSAGLVARPCTKFVRPGGYLLVNDSHSDARSVFVGSFANDANSHGWKLVASWNDELSTFTSKDLHLCFQVRPKKKTKKQQEDSIESEEPVSISYEQVQESIEVGSVGKRSFHMVKESKFYLFQKAHASSADEAKQRHMAFSL